MKRFLNCRSTILAGLFAVLAVPLLAGCRAEEQNRVTMYEPGVYKGVEQMALSEDQVRALRYRARDQSGSIDPAGGGGGSVSGKVLDARQLEQRVGSQSGS